MSWWPWTTIRELRLRVDALQVVYSLVSEANANCVTSLANQKFNSERDKLVVKHLTEQVEQLKGILSNKDNELQELYIKYYDIRRKYLDAAAAGVPGTSLPTRPVSSH